jgi:putative tricarboxylic transport membrane protein
MLKRDPASVSISIATSIGNQFHIAAALVARAAGVPPAKMRVVVFNSGGESTTAALGGHVTLTVTSASNLLPLLKTGAPRALAVSSPRRVGGELAQVPTWKEQKLDVVLDQWRVMFAPAGLNRAQIAYWEDVLAKMARSNEWKKELELNVWDDAYRNSDETNRFLVAAYAELRTVLVELGLAK